MRHRAPIAAAIRRGRGRSSVAASAISALVGSVSRRGPDRVEAVDADLVDDGADEGRAVDVLAGLGLEAEQPAQQPVERVAAAAALGANRALDHLLASGSPIGDTAFMTYSAWPSTSDMNAVTRSSTARCSGVASTAMTPGAVALPADHLGQLADGVAQAAGAARPDRCRSRRSSAVDLVEHVLAQPRHRGELHPVGDLVQADPEPEVARVDAAAGARRRRCSARPAAAGRRAGRRTRTGRAPCRTGSRARRRPGRR